MDTAKARAALDTIAAMELRADDPQLARLAAAVEALSAFIEIAERRAAPVAVRQIGAEYLARRFAPQGAIDASGD